MSKVTTVLFALNAPADLRCHLSQTLAAIPGISYLFPDSHDDDAEMLRLAASADIIVGWRVKLEILQAAPLLRMFIFGGVGAQSMLAPLRIINRQQPVSLVKCVANTYATAQHATAMLLALTNRIIPHHTWMKEGHWRRGDEHASSVPLRDLSIGLLGYGDVNRRIHRFLTPFDVEFRVLRRREPIAEPQLPGIAETYSVDKLDRFLQRCDVLFIGVPLTTATTNMIGATELELLGTSSLLVNVARGPVVNELALYAALKHKTIAGAAIDVWYQYRPEPDGQGHQHPSTCPFHELDNVVLSPHRAASPVFDMRRWNEVVEHIKRFHNDEQPIGRIDLDHEY